MKVKTLGDKANPAIVMVPGMFCTSDMPEVIARYLQDDFFLILPTLDGHHEEEPVYHSKEDDGRGIVSWLHDNDIERVALLQGTSMGAEVALEVAHQLDRPGEIPVDRCLFDGGPFFHFPRPFRAKMASKFMRYMDMMRGKEKDEAIDALMNDRFVKKLGSDSLESYRGLLDGFYEISQWIDKDSVRRIADTCYKCVLPLFTWDKQKSFTFLYSKDEPAWKSKKTLLKAYPGSQYAIVDGYGHGGFQTEEPEEYAGFMRDLALDEGV